MIQRTNVVEVKSKTERTQELRKEYQDLSIYDQFEKYDSFKSQAETEGIDWFLLMCQDSHFAYLAKNNLIEKF